MSEAILLRTGGLLAAAVDFTLADLAALPGKWQIPDVSQIDPKRSGAAVKLAGLLERLQPAAEAQWLGLHSSADDFHASIPLSAVAERAVVIYSLGGGPLPAKQGGPIRFFIPDFAACHTQEIDECANVKFVDRMEFTATKGFDNRPHDGDSHEELHRRQA